MYHRVPSGCTSGATCLNMKLDSANNLSVSHSSLRLWPYYMSQANHMPTPYTHMSNTSSNYNSQNRKSMLPAAMEGNEDWLTLKILPVLFVTLLGASERSLLCTCCNIYSNRKQVPYKCLLLLLLLQV